MAHSQKLNGSLIMFTRKNDLYCSYIKRKLQDKEISFIEKDADVELSKNCTITNLPIFMKDNNYLNALEVIEIYGYVK